MTEKKLLAKSKAEYRGVQIYETDKGFSLFLNEKRHNCESLSEATALIDAAYELSARIVKVVNLVEGRSASVGG